MSDVDVAVLAAGSARRFGSNKLLATIDGEALVVRALRRARAAGIGPVILVTGFEAAAVAAFAAGEYDAIIHNPRFADGIGTSIAAAAAGTGGDRGLMITLADQPLVTAAHLGELADAWQSAATRIVATAYAGIVGVPALFPPAARPALVALDGNRGARTVIESGSHPVLPVGFAAAAVDIDRPADLDGLSPGP